MVKLIFIFSFVFGICRGQVDLTDMPTQLAECSGLINLGDTLFISLNDGGNKSKLYLFDKNGTMKKAVNVKDCKNQDWEALAFDEKKGHIFIGDIGNNANKREKFKIYKLELDDVLSKNSVDFKTIEYRLPDQKKFPPKKENLHFDAESLVFYNDSLYIFTKCRAVPFDGRSFVYSIPSKKGKYKARRLTDLKLPATSWLEDSATDATIYKDELFILTYSKIYRYRITNHELKWLNTYNLDGYSQKEGITVFGNSIYYCSESSILGKGKLTEYKF